MLRLARRGWGRSALSVEPIGLATILIGLIGLSLGRHASIHLLIVATVFGSAAAFLIGGANIQPAHLLLGFVAAGFLVRPREAAAAIRAVTPPAAGFWLACIVIYGVFGAAMLPRLLEGATEIVPLGTPQDYESGGIVPLSPVSSNLTQSIYLIGDLICFTIVVVVGSTQSGFKAAAHALMTYAAVNVFFALLDIGTYSTGTQSLLEFMRNAQYTLHDEEQAAGLKRIVGSFPEASAFARSTLGALGFVGTLWLCGRRPGWTGPLALLSLVFVVLSTSSTGLLGVVPILAILYVTAVRMGSHGSNGRRIAAVTVIAPPLVISIVLGVLLDSEAFATARDYVELLILNKSTSSSGIERAAWNTIGLQNFVDTWGVGVGAGTVRTSSLPIALLSNVGLVGTTCYCLFLGCVFFRGKYVARSFHGDVVFAARNACLGLLLGDVVASPTIEQGLLFYVFAGLASTSPETGITSLDSS